ncbi:hypothetical protein H4CHR_02904 [Variovorax sp. PBS-H4]|uniref:hypothetical protein n=1 Tax=Variovorax sp. PBS-H4 TaxID=434008 RepID=UPI001316194D|nr:hypothetical protein [Variovorax sp. PBS-H4]VTU31913.1 hypothetical protein H4CHR_02904 [Variovorax sp. PBS-H4]
MRYSPRPIEDYGRIAHGKDGPQFVGPRNSVFLSKDVECWNLAFLSFDYDARPTPANPQFTSLVVKTVATRLDTGEIDYHGAGSMSVRSLLKLPAPQFVKVIEVHSILRQLPLYKALGNRWLATIKERSWKCATYEDGVDDDVESVAQAQALLASIASRR